MANVDVSEDGIDVHSSPTTNHMENIEELMRSQTCTSLTPNLKSELEKAVRQHLRGSYKKIIFGAVVTCPWYAASQDTEDLRSCNNSVMVIYVNHNEQILASVDSHPKQEHMEASDQNWFHCVEVLHFTRTLLKGKSRYVEALNLPESALFIQHSDWQLLMESLSKDLIFNLRGFLVQTRGRAVCAVARKTSGKDLDLNKMCLKDKSTVADFCESFRLITHVSNALNRKGPFMGELEDSTVSETNRFAGEALALIKNSSKCLDHGILRQDMLKVLLNWTQELDQLLASHPFTDPDIPEKQLKSWLLSVRLAGAELKSHKISDSSKQKVEALLQNFGDDLYHIPPENVLLIAKAGSSLYNLETPESDIDYVIIYVDPIDKILTTFARPIECIINRGKEQPLEYGAYEVRLLSQMLLKGSVDMMELVFSDNLDYVSESWTILQNKRNSFITQTAVQKYFEMIDKKLKMSESGNHIGQRKKLVYQVVHKITCVEDLIRGNIPRVRCAGSFRDFVMRIRQDPWEGGLAYDRLREMIGARLTTAKKDFEQRKQQISANISQEFLTDWLLLVRGLM